MARHKNANWFLNEPTKAWDEVVVAVLMDIRDELQEIKSVLRCPNTTPIPFILDRIDKNTTPKRKPKRKKK